ncbi:helix-turn-helix transcriptional regulator [Kitasatospora sp. NBC_01300]|uniref:helix-turn-helix domain-containing protein n=1 Tax=Kitasatospora sp. NBC_01300 TaxID=2903574 RepID=UPI00352E9851|nr:helix-turn-helix transcriptional regulator [Kitasatospora sp. NBC_01300]WSK08266.1 helix-turn-helix transcriptional regulator [Kitasatospora sp. NBC_01300]
MVNIKEIDPESSPWAPFAVQLRRSRMMKGLKQEQLARKCGVSPSYVSFVELARRPPSEKFAAKADEVLQTGGTLMLMWWQHKHTALVPGFPEYANYENGAEQIRLFEINIIPGLLQTRSYATAFELGKVGQNTATPQEAEERVAFRLTRQQCLDRTPPPFLHAVMDESCLRRVVGGRDVMIEQMNHLEHMATQPNVVVQVVPFSLGENQPFLRMVHLLTMPGRRLVAYTENEQRGYLDRDNESVAGLAKSYDRLAVEAANRADSLAMIRSARRNFEWMSD